jgi:predicted nucleotidyltransferase
LACEVGSRAWGLDNPNSDYDVKFIYVRRLNWYLGVEEVKRDLIDDNSDFDMNGWDIRKALQLLRESNCGILEWLNSSHLYRSEPLFLERAKALSNDTHCRRSLLLAYWGKAGKHYRDYIVVENAEGQVTLKKYLFIIQALLSARWILAFSPNGVDLPPQDFNTLLQSFKGPSSELPTNIYDLSVKLVARKRDGTLGIGARYKDLGMCCIPFISFPLFFPPLKNANLTFFNFPSSDKWTEASLSDLEIRCKAMEKKNRPDALPFNNLFVDMVTHTAGFKIVEGASYFEQIGLHP